MTRFLGHPWGWTTVVPLACAAHCLAVPVLVLAAPALVPGPQLEWALLGATVLAAGLSLGSGLRIHGVRLPLVPVGAGILLWAASLLHLFHPVPEPLTTVAAALTVAGGLLWNSRLHCSHRGSACPACEEEEGAESAPARAPSVAGRPVPTSAGSG